MSGRYNLWAADPRVQSVTATASSENPWGIDEDRDAIHVIDGSGMDMFYVYHTNSVYPISTMWISGKGNGTLERAEDANGYDNPNPGTVAGIQWIRFELPYDAEMEKIHVWNYNQWSSAQSQVETGPVGVYRGLRNVTIEYSVTGGPDSSEWTELGEFEFPMAPLNGEDGYTGFETDAGALPLTFGGALTRYIVITADDVNGNWGGMGKFEEADVNGHDPNLYYGLSEVAFFGQARVAVLTFPESFATDVDPYAIMTWLEGKYNEGHDVYIGTNRTEVTNATRTSHPGMVFYSEDQVAASYKPPVPLELFTSYYWKIDEVNSAGGVEWPATYVWKFKTADYYPDVVVSGDITATTGSNLYQTDGSFTASGRGLDPSGLYHSNNYLDMWVSVNTGSRSYNDGTVTGPTWIAYEFVVPVKLSDMWIWNYNEDHPSGGTELGLKNITIQYSMTGGSTTGEWATLTPDPSPLAEADFPAMGWNALAWDASLNPNYDTKKMVHTNEIDFSGIETKYVVITPDSGLGNGWWGPLTWYLGLSEVRFYKEVGHATKPSPYDGEVTGDPDVILSWTLGSDAASQKLYFGTNPRSLDQVATLSGAVTTFDPNDPDDDSTDLQWGVKYYWRVESTNSTAVVYNGNVWSFLVDGSLIIDDMESASLNWTGTGGGTLLLINAPVVSGYGIGTAIRSGRRSVKLVYDNSAGSFLSGMTAPIASLPIGPDWTIRGMKVLVVPFWGNQNNDFDQPLYVEVSDGTVTVVKEYDGDYAGLAFEEWIDWTIRLQDYNDVGMNLSAISSISIGVGYKLSGPTAGGSGKLFIDDVRLGTPACYYDNLHPAGDIIGEDCAVDELDRNRFLAEWLVGVVPPSTVGLVAHMDFEDVNALDIVQNAGSAGSAADGTLIGDAEIFFDPIRDSNVLRLGNVDGATGTADSYMDIGGGRALEDPATWSDMYDFTITMAFKSDLPFADYPSGFIHLGGKATTGEYDEDYHGSTWYNLISDDDDYGYLLEFKTYSGEYPHGQFARAEIPDDLPDDQQWHHWAGTMDDTETKLYLDGILVHVIPNITEPPGRRWGIGPTYIGAMARWLTSDDNLVGKIDEVRFYDRVLSEAEIASVSGVAVSDFNNDMIVNFADYAILTLDYLKDPLLWP